MQAVAGPAVASSLDVRVTDDVAFAFHITNNASKQLEITFPSGKTHDIVVLDSIGREVWRWSDGRLFTQVMQNKLLDTSETMTYEARWDPVQHHGQYVAVASLMSENHPVEHRVDFALP